MASNHVHVRDVDDDVGDWYLYIAEQAFAGAQIMRRIRERQSNRSTRPDRQQRQSNRSTDSNRQQSRSFRPTGLNRQELRSNRPTGLDISDVVPDALPAAVEMRFDDRIGEDRNKVRELANLHSDVPATVETYLYSVGILHHGRRPKMDKRARDREMAFHRNAIRELAAEKVKEKSDTLRLTRLTSIDRDEGLAGALVEDTRSFRLLQLYWKYAMDLPNDVEYELLLKCCVNMKEEDIRTFLSKKKEKTSYARLWKRFMELDHEARILQQPGWATR